MTITYHPEVEQGSDEWAAMRCGLITASEMKLLLTPAKLAIADNDKVRAHVWELLAQRVTGYVEPKYVSDDMLRGHTSEPVAREIYAERVAKEPVTEIGFVTNDSFGFTIGYSPDALVGDRGLWECKAPRQKTQMETIVLGDVPIDHLLQVQTGLMVSDRDWLDFSSYCGGMYMPTFRVYPDEKVQAAILEASRSFEAKIAEKMEAYERAVEAGRMVMTERIVEEEMFIGAEE
jgi:predicted phage-related endonuclease